MKNILIVEDENELRDTLTIHLKKSGYNVISAENGRVALEKIKSFPVDLVLLDLMMPELGGTGFLYEAKNVLADSVPIIVLTNREESSLPERVSEYLIKSNTSLDTIVETIVKYIS